MASLLIEVIFILGTTGSTLHIFLFLVCLVFPLERNILLLLFRFLFLVIEAGLI